MPGFDARRKGRDLSISHIEVGAAARLETLWPHSALRRFLLRREPLHMPWEAIGSADREVRLRTGWEARAVISGRSRRPAAGAGAAWARPT